MSSSVSAPDRRAASVFESTSTIRTWDQDYYHPAAERHYDRAFRAIAARIGLREGVRVLDAGCGPGVHSIRLARTGATVLGVDRSEAMLAEARHRIDRAGFGPKIELRTADLTNLDLPDACVDHAVCWGVLTHIRRADIALRHLARVVRPGGWVVVSVLNGTAIDHAAEGVARAVLGKRLDSVRGELGEGVEYALHDQPLWVWRFRIPGLITAAEAAGLELRGRTIGELTEIHRRLRGPARRMLLAVNAAAFRMGAPARAACTNLVYFQRLP